MAYKTADHSDMSLFGNRLWKLMEEQHICTSKKLAEKLYDKGLIKVNQKDKEYGLEDDLRKRGINAINRAIQEHINSENTDKLQGQYINAYCVYFKCSADYLLGYIPCQTHKATDIVKATGLSEIAVKSLRSINGMNKWFPGTQNDKLDAINLILSDEHEATSFSSLLDVLAGYFQFNIGSDKNTLKYTLGEHGITPCQIHKIGNGISYDPSQVHFGLQDLESMYYLRIWDAIKELKEEYRKQKQAPTA